MIRLCALILCLSCSTPLFADNRYLGVNYTHWQVGAGCDLTNRGILVTYHRSGVRATVKSQLSAMRAQKMTSLRFMIWYGTTPEESWGQVQVGRDGRLSKRLAMNLAQFLSDVDAAGFTRLSVSFAPKGTIGPQFANYDPASLTLNWAFLVQVRGLLKSSGIADTRVDLLNEGSPNLYTRSGPSYDANLTDYLQEIYRRYVDAFGHTDVTVSAISEDPSALPALLTILQGAGRPMPLWYEVHAYMWWYPDLADGVADALRQDDIALAAVGLTTQPIVLGETYYGDKAVARGALTYLAGTTRPLSEVIAWAQASSATCQPMDVTPPYSVAAFESLRW